MTGKPGDTMPISFKRLADGSFVRVFPDGRTEPYTLPQPDFQALDGLSDDEVTAAAEADPDAVPMTDEEFSRGLVAGQVARIRKATGLSQNKFANRYGIPVGTLRDWEQGRARPDGPTLSYLKVIAAMPDQVAQVLKAG